MYHLLTYQLQALSTTENFDSEFDKISASVEKAT